MTNYLTSINWLAWQIPNAVRQINIKHSPRAPLQHYEEIWGCDVKFDQSEYAVILQDNVKDCPFPNHDPIKLAEMKVKLDMALNKLFEAESLINRIELHIRRAIEHGNHQKPHIAKTLGMSERNLTRALADRGTSFIRVKNNVIQNLAKAKINQGLPLAEIAHSLGYNDQSTFTRAYKKWFGHPPGKDKNIGQHSS